MLFNISDFFADLGIVSVDLFPMDRRAMPQTAAGVQVPVQIGQRLWEGQITVKPLQHVAANVLRARLARLTEADAAFLAYPPELCVGGQTGSVASIASDRRQITLTGVTVAEGDYLGVTASGVYGLHFVTGVSGSDVEVVPPIPAQIGAGAAATTDRPPLAAVMRRDTRGPALAGSSSARFSFGFVQTLRAVT